MIVVIVLLANGGHGGCAGGGGADTWRLSRHCVRYDWRSSLSASGVTLPSAVLSQPELAHTIISTEIEINGGCNRLLFGCRGVMFAL